jgi:hypothetical protein
MPHCSKVEPVRQEVAPDQRVACHHILLGQLSTHNDREFRLTHRRHLG